MQTPTHCMQHLLGASIPVQTNSCREQMPSGMQRPSVPRPCHLKACCAQADSQMTLTEMSCTFKQPPVCRLMWVEPSMHTHRLLTRSTRHPFLSSDAHCEAGAQSTVGCVLCMHGRPSSMPSTERKGGALNCRAPRLHTPTVPRNPPTLWECACANLGGEQDAEHHPLPGSSLCALVYLMCARCVSKPCETRPPDLGQKYLGHTFRVSPGSDFEGFEERGLRDCRPPPPCRCEVDSGKQGWGLGPWGLPGSPGGRCKGRQSPWAGCQSLASLKLGTAAGRGFRPAQPHLALGTLKDGLGWWAGIQGTAGPGPCMPAAEPQRICAHVCARVCSRTSHAAVNAGPAHQCVRSHTQAHTRVLHINTGNGPGGGHVHPHTAQNRCFSALPTVSPGPNSGCLATICLVDKCVNARTRQFASAHGVSVTHQALYSGGRPEDPRS